MANVLSVNGSRAAGNGSHLDSYPLSHNMDSQAEIDIPNDTLQQEITRLRAENAELKAQALEMEELLDNAAKSNDDWNDRHKEFESLLEEKSEVIRGLHLKLRQLEQETPATTSGNVSKEERASFDRLRAELEERQQQMEQDEEALMTQMRQMELAMSRERAELARMRNEVQRMSAELTHEIEMASRDAGLRDRLQGMQRRQQESNARRDSNPSVPAAPAPGAPAQAREVPGLASHKKNSSGLIRRMFGK